MQVGMNSWSLPPEITGGLDIHVWELAQALIDMDVDVKLFLPDKNVKNDQKRSEIVPINYSNGLSYEGISKLNKKVFNKLRKRKPDIFHTHDWLGVEAGYRAKKYLDSGWVFSCHSLEWMRAGKGNGSNRIRKREKIGIEESDRVITVSNWMKNEILDRFEVEKNKLAVINNGRRNLEESDFSPRTEHDIGRDFFVLYVGRLAEQKGVRYLLYAAWKVLKEFKNIKFIIGGRGPLLEPLKKFKDLLGINKSVKFTGFIPESQLSSYYSEADVFVSPSLQEPFGMTLLEARKQGTPVISTPAGALESLEGGSECISVNERCSEDIYQAITGLIQAKDSYCAADKTAYSWEQAAKETLKVYDQVLA